MAVTAHWWVSYQGCTQSIKQTTAPWQQGSWEWPQPSPDLLLPPSPYLHMDWAIMAAMELGRRRSSRTMEAPNCTGAGRQAGRQTMMMVMMQESGCSGLHHDGDDAGLWLMMMISVSGWSSLYCDDDGLDLSRSLHGSKPPTLSHPH